MQSKVLHIIDHISLGGAQRILRGILEDHPEHAFLTLRRRKQKRRSFSMPVTQSILPLSLPLLAYCLQFFSLPRQIRHGEFQIIECHLTGSWILGLLMAPFLSDVNIHFLFHEHDAARMGKWYYPWLVKRAAHVGSVAAVSHTVSQIIESFGVPRKKISVLPNYVDLGQFSTQDSQNQPLCPAAWDEKYIVVGAASRMTRGKGWQDQLKIADRLREQPYRFLFAGSGRDFGKLQKAVIREDLSDQIHLAGYVEDMKNFYHSIDLLIFPSRVEAFGLVPVEAQACGIPVIVYDSQVSSETLLEGSALRVPMGDANAMTDAILSLRDQPLALAELKKRGLENSRRFSYPVFRERLHAIYAQLLEDAKV